MPKPNYDTGLARMAGNIAAGFTQGCNAGYLSNAMKNRIAVDSVDIAQRIVAELQGFVPKEQL